MLVLTIPLKVAKVLSSLLLVFEEREILVVKFSFEEKIILVVGVVPVAVSQAG
jgi:hypothetical protein